MRRLTLSILALTSTTLCAHTVSLNTQYLKLYRQNEVGKQVLINARGDINPRWGFILNGAYLERFDLYERRLGTGLVFSPQAGTTTEVTYSKAAAGSEILPSEQLIGTIYQSITHGTSAFLTIWDARYSQTRVNLARLGLELEKIKNITLIPQVSLGQATFRDPQESREVNNLQFKVIYHRENNYFISLLAAQGIEASQGIVGRSSETVRTRTGALGAGFYIFEHTKAEALFEYIDFKQLKNQFLTSSVGLTRMF